MFGNCDGCSPARERRRGGAGGGGWRLRGGEGVQEG